MPRRQRQPLAALFSAPLRHQRFRALILAATGWAMATGVAAPFFNAYGIQSLKLSFATLALFGVATSAVTLITQPFVGRLQDRYGDRRVLVVSVVGVILLPWGWVLSTPTFLLPLWTTSIFWPGITQGLIILHLDHDSALVDGAATLPAYRGRGLQKALLSARLLHANEQGALHAFSRTSLGSISQANLQKMGMQVFTQSTAWRRI
jgi:MFS-type transporter involved in bile tolerance (Atg22 family)